MPDENKTIRLITFRVGPESFVLDIMAVRQIVGYTGSTPVPKAPDFIEGIIILRNEVIPVIDLRERLFPKHPAEKSPLVLVTHTPYGYIGLKVDEVRKLINVDVSTILPPPDLIRELQGDLFIGVIQHSDEVYLLIDLETLLTASEQELLATVHSSVSEEAS